MLLDWYFTYYIVNMNLICSFQIKSNSTSTRHCWGYEFNREEKHLHYLHKLIQSKLYVQDCQSTWNRNLIHSLTTRQSISIFTFTHVLNLVLNLTTRKYMHFLLLYNSCQKFSWHFNHQGILIFTFTLWPMY